MERRHLSLSIEGGIRWAKELCGCIEVDGRTLNTEKEVCDYLRGQLALGRKYLPMGDCDNFDYQQGCLGHTIPDHDKVKK